MSTTDRAVLFLEQSSSSDPLRKRMDGSFDVRCNIALVRAKNPTTGDFLDTNEEYRAKVSSFGYK